MKILIPTDFSELSKVAIKYATDLSKEIDIKLVLLHVLDIDTSSMTRLSSKRLNEASKTIAEQDIKEFAASLNKENSHDIIIDHKVVFGGSIANEIETFAIKNDIDIICIGTKGASGLKKVLFGSNAASIIENSSIPVLTVPEFTRFRGIKNIVYSSDLFNLEEEVYTVVMFAKLMNSWLHVLHIDRGDEHYKGDLKLEEKNLRKNTFYKKINLSELKSSSILQGINKFVADIDADMMIMFTHRTSLIEKVFQKSITQNTAFQTRIPLLTFQKDE